MKTHIALFVILFLSLSFLPVLKAQVVINEILASNSSFIYDPDFNESSDWIELYNMGNTPVSLKNYGLTDNLSNLTKWKIKDDIQIGPKSYLLIWADGKDTGLHTSFKLSADGEELALVLPGLTIADSIRFVVQKVNVSYGRESERTSE